MGRLFWKFLLAFLVSLLIAGAGVGTVVWLHNSGEQERTPPPGGPGGDTLIRSAAALLVSGGSAAVGTWAAELVDGRTQALRIVDEEGRELLGRHVSAAQIERARADESAALPGQLVRRVVAPDGRRYLVFLPPELLPPRPHFHRPPPPWPPLAAVLLAGLAFSALGAWYLAKPIRNLRWAFEGVAAGRLDTRVAPRMGSRRDEMADLGRDFDRMAQRLQGLVGSQRRLLHDVSHELRSPLARLQAAVGLARQNPQKIEASLDRIERESQRLDELVGELLTLSRLEAGTGTLRREHFDLVELVASVVDDARFEAQAKGRDITFAAGDEIIIDGSVELLHRALENVIRNAVKYSAEGSSVDVSIQSEAQGQSVRIEVSDRGPGIAEQDLGSVFEPFYRGANANASGGFGLGLAIARRAVEAHGGAIVARNRPEPGLTVAISLPLARPGAASMPAA
ncbi:MAG TPA: ATP-binding protein [Rhodocyclaceae bacterium]|nr:ATP-binding protein [Rhodocyclaceae bacterium]HNA03734.1 ATP-binding protein [Rhodocyclaceae bacterium]HNB79444.1 ATP-binding protein [Rhodocyclaceae bacterium]HNC62087.1 ATP-binding protein [Rhodocyclaceae bacterium]HNH12421.1 ATP-binding protein [Rhodocyclaceae bacterium]